MVALDFDETFEKRLTMALMKRKGNTRLRNDPDDHTK